MIIGKYLSETGCSKVDVLKRKVQTTKLKINTN